MGSYKTACVLSLGSLAVLVVGFMIASEVRAGDVRNDLGGDLPIAGVVSQDTLSQASAYAGDYTFVGGQKEREGLDAAVETSVNAVSPLVRGLARKRLLASNPIPKHIAIELEGDALEITFDGKGHTAKLDGTPIRSESPEGEKIKISHRIQGSKLTEFIDSSQGDRRNTFKLNREGNRLTLDVSITSSHLPVPVDYRLTFKRK